MTNTVTHSNDISVETGLMDSTLWLSNTLRKIKWNKMLESNIPALSTEQRRIVMRTANKYRINPMVIMAFILVEYKYIDKQNNQEGRRKFRAQLEKFAGETTTNYETFKREERTGYFHPEKTTLAAQSIYESMQRDETKYQLIMKAISRLLQQKTKYDIESHNISFFKIKY